MKFLMDEEQRMTQTQPTKYLTLCSLIKNCEFESTRCSLVQLSGTVNSRKKKEKQTDFHSTVCSSINPHKGCSHTQLNS